MTIVPFTMPQSPRPPGSLPRCADLHCPLSFQVGPAGNACGGSGGPNNSRQRCALKSMILHLVVESCQDGPRTHVTKSNLDPWSSSSYVEYGSTKAMAPGLAWTGRVCCSSESELQVRRPLDPVHDWVHKATHSACARATASGAWVGCEMTSSDRSGPYSESASRIPMVPRPRPVCTMYLLFP